MSVRKLVIGLGTVGLAVTFASGAASAKQPKETPPPPPQVNALLQCRGIADGAERLACYDKTAASIGDAFAKQELVVFDKESVQKTKRGLFGFSIPNLGIFGDEEGEINQIEGTIAGYGHNPDGGYIFRLADGSRWSQMDGKPIAIPPQNGDKVVVKRGALGSYILSLAKQPGVKVKRIN
jgi:hypothetical protein